MIEATDQYDGTATMQDIVIAAMVLLGYLEPGRMPPQVEIDNAMFHLRCLIPESMRAHSELMRMHNLHPAPVIIEKEHGGQNDVAMDSLDSNKEH